MTSTTIRVDRATHGRIQRLHELTGKPMTEVVRDALDALDRVRFATQVGRELDTLRADPAQWADYLADADELPAGDGIT